MSDRDSTRFMDYEKRKLDFITGLGENVNRVKLAMH